MKHINRRFFLILAAVVLLFSFEGLAKTDINNTLSPVIGKHAKELDDLLASKVLRVAMYKQDTPPFYSRTEEVVPGLTPDSAQVKGLDAELIIGFARKLGVKVKFVRTAESINDVVDMVAKGEADIGMCKLSITFERATQVLFTKPYINLRKGLIVNRVLLEQEFPDKSKTEAIQQLSGTLGVIGNSSYVTYAKQRFGERMEIKEFRAWKDVVDAVYSREIIAGFRDEAEIKKVTLDDKKYAMEMLTVVLKGDFDPKGIALPSDAHYLKALLDFYIDSLGLELNANNVLFDYDNVISHINRYRENQMQGEQL